MTGRKIQPRSHETQSLIDKAFKDECDWCGSAGHVAGLHKEMNPDPHKSSIMLINNPLPVMSKF